MNKLAAVIGIVGGVIAALTALSGGAVWALEQRFDERYVLVAESLEGKLLDKQEQIFREELKDDPDKEVLKFLRLQEKQLKQKIEGK
jgi:hypothetical protein